MIKLLLLWLSILVLVCICCGGLAFVLSINRTEKDKSDVPAISEEPTQTGTPLAVATSTLTVLPSTTATSSPTALKTPTITESANDTFLPYQSSTTLEPSACIPEMAKGLTATVIRVIDGDTIDVLIDGVKQRVRYIGVDSPEVDYPFGKEALSENAKLVENKEVLLIQDKSDVDRYQRLLRYVIAKDIFVNLELVHSGYAMSKGYTPDTACQEVFDQAELEAKAAGLGIWAPTPTPPASSGTPDLSTGSIVIQNIFFDGLVRRVESDEYAQIANTGGTAIDLTGWRLNAGTPGQDFVFPTFRLESGQSCRVYTNETHTESGGFSFASKYAIWNNQGDCGYLYDSQGNLIDDYCY